MRRLAGEALRKLVERGVEIEAIARLVFRLQEPYNPGLTLEECLDSVLHVVQKREVEYAILTGLTLDQMAEEGRLDEPLLSIVREDHHLYGIDEVLALSIVNVYGSIGLSNYGYLDREKPDFLGEIGRNRPGRVNTFLDDVLAAVVAAACARIAHRSGDRREQKAEEVRKAARDAEQEAVRLAGEAGLGDDGAGGARDERRKTAQA